MKAKLGMAILSIIVIAILCYLIWQGMLLVPADTARLWALLATASLPIVAWAGWYFGHTEARGRLRGIDQAVDKVMGAMTRMAGLQTSAARAMQPVPEPPMIVLPEVEIVPRQLGNGRDIVEL